MAEYQADGAYEAPRGVSVQTMVNWMGAAASVALVAGIGYWGYKMVMRDVSGVPVVKAMEGEMRIAPEDPGGQPAAHQGLAVNAIAADGVAEETADTLHLAPKAMTLRAEDVPTGAIPSEETRALVASSEPKPDANRMASIQALADRLAQGAAPLSGFAADESTAPDAAATAEAGIAEEDLPADMTAQEEGEPQVQDDSIDLAAVAQGIVEETQAGIEEVVAQSAAQTPEEKALALALATAAAEQTLEEEEKLMNAPQEGAVVHSLRPKTRPLKLASVMATATPTLASVETGQVAEAATPAVGGLDVAATDVPAGTRLAQLGAFESAEVARSEWDRLNGRFSEFLDGKQRVIQRAQSGGRTFYRLRAMGFEDLADARRFCAAFVAEKSDCIPVVSK